MCVSRVRVLAGCLLVLSIAVSCASRSMPPPPELPTPETPLEPVPHTEYGLASWYGRERQGRRTASGEPYDSAQLTAAHRTAPFQTYALVTHLANGRTVSVRINDRGPSATTRIIDLSHAAARALDMVRAGVARVRIDWLSQKDLSHATDGPGGVFTSPELHDPPRFVATPGGAH